jgi:hypothetical protein
MRRVTGAQIRRAGRAALRFVVAAASIGVLALAAMKASTVHHEAGKWHTMLAPTSVACHFGDVVTFVTDQPSQLSLYSGNYLILRKLIPPGKHYVFHANGDDTYTVAFDPIVRFHERTEPERGSPRGRAVPVCFILIFLIVIWYALPSYRGGPSGIRVPAVEAIVTLVLAGIAAFAFPPYLHNDEIGGGNRADWGYLAWGYVDTIPSIGQALHYSGIAGLITATAMTKPLLTPGLAAPLTLFLSALQAAQVISGLSMALTALGVLVIGRTLFGPVTGRFAAALFCFAPMSFAYGTSFYQETGYLAAMVWALIFVRSAERTGSRKAFLAASICIPFSVAAKGLPVIVLIIALVFVTLPWLSRNPLRNLYAAGLYFAFGFVGTIVFWPFLWRDFAFRLAYAFGGRLAYDGVVGISVPLTTRVRTALIDELIHQDPVTVGLIVCAAMITIVKRDRPRLYLWTCFLGSAGFLLPTSNFLEHYILYALPFASLLAGSVLANRRRYVWAAGPLLALQVGWSLIYAPYPAMARIGCWSFTCSANRFGLAEPVYGLREACTWLAAHTPPGDPVGALATPHIVQSWLPERRVYSVWMGANRKGQEIALKTLPVKYLVGNSMSLKAGQRQVSPLLKLLWSAGTRAGSPSVYENLAYKPALRWLDAPPPPVRIALSRSWPLRTVGFAAPFGSFDPVTYYPLVRPDPAIFDWRSFNALVNLGGDVLLANDPKQLDAGAVGYAYPNARVGTSVSIPIPTLDGMKTITEVRLHRVPATVPGTAAFAGKIIVDARTDFATDVLAVTFRSPIDLDWHPYEIVDASCAFGKYSAVTAAPVTARERTAYLVMESDEHLKDCRGPNTEIYLLATFYDIDPKLPFAVDASMVWGKFIGDVRIAPSDAVALKTTLPTRRFDAVPDDDAVRDWARKNDSSGVVMRPSEKQYRLEFEDEWRTTRTAKLLHFIHRTIAPAAYRLSGPYRFCKYCKLTDSCTMRFAKPHGWVGYRWYIPEGMSTSILALDLRRFAVPRQSDVELDWDLPPKRTCRYDLGKNRKTRALFIHIDRIAADGCSLDPNTPIQLTLYPAKNTNVMTVNPVAFVDAVKPKEQPHALKFVPGKAPTQISKHACFDGMDLK